MPKSINAPKILLVEDSEDDAYFFNRTLQRSGVTCAVHHVENGAEAVEFLAKASQSDSGELPPVMFLDLKMPLLNGFEVLEWLQTQSFRSSIQVIVLSGSEHDADKTRAAELGAADYLVKPVRVGDFHRLLKHLCPPEVGARV